MCENYMKFKINSVQNKVSGTQQCTFTYGLSRTAFGLRWQV